MKITALLLLSLMFFSCEKKENTTHEYKYRIVYQSDTCLCEGYQRGYQSESVSPTGIMSPNCAEVYFGQLKVELINRKKP